LKCLDTDLLVGVLRKQERAGRKVDELDQQGRQATTAVNAFELFYGASKSRMVEENIREAQKLLSRLELLPLSIGSAERAGILFGSLERKGLSIEFRDSMIAGIALEHRLTLVTRNRRDYARVPGLTLEEW
jgi:tRNA(fMet)-specific endonuclease VapC